MVTLAPPQGTAVRASGVRPRVRSPRVTTAPGGFDSMRAWQLRGPLPACARGAAGSATGGGVAAGGRAAGAAGRGGGIDSAVGWAGRAGAGGAGAGSTWGAGGAGAATRVVSPGAGSGARLK